MTLEVLSNLSCIMGSPGELLKILKPEFQWLWYNLVGHQDLVKTLTVNPFVQPRWRAPDLEGKLKILKFNMCKNNIITVTTSGFTKKRVPVLIYCYSYISSPQIFSLWKKGPGLINFSKLQKREIT